MTVAEGILPELIGRSRTGLLQNMHLTDIRTADSATMGR